MEEPMDFNFPFRPYDIQTAFMSKVFQCLKEEKLGIFESPTGTGKSLSLICGALTWYMQYEKHRKVQLQKQIEDCNVLQKDDNVGEDWFSAAVKQSAARAIKHLYDKELKSIKAKEERMQELKNA